MKEPVMIIDDSLVVRKILEVSLRREGIDQLIFPDGMTALRALQQQPDRVPAVIVLDLHLPDVNGFAIARMLRSSPIYDRTAILVLTGYDTIWNRWRARFLKDTHFLTKPFKIREILRLIQELLAESVVLTSVHADVSQEATDHAHPGGVYHEHSTVASQFRQLFGPEGVRDHPHR